jgi:hypothetical protein
MSIAIRIVFGLLVNIPSFMHCAALDISAVKKEEKEVAQSVSNHERAHALECLALAATRMKRVSGKSIAHLVAELSREKSCYYHDIINRYPLRKYDKNRLQAIRVEVLDDVTQNSDDTLAWIMTYNTPRESHNKSKIVRLATSTQRFIMWAERGYAQIVEKALWAGADINMRDSEGYTALSAAAQRGRMGMVRLLMQAGANSALKTDKGFRAADVAFAQGHYDVGDFIEEELKRQDEQRKITDQVRVQQTHAKPARTNKAFSAQEQEAHARRKQIKEQQRLEALARQQERQRLLMQQQQKAQEHHAHAAALNKTKQILERQLLQLQGQLTKKQLQELNKLKKLELQISWFEAALKTHQERQLQASQRQAALACALMPASPALSASSNSLSPASSPDLAKLAQERLAPAQQGSPVALQLPPRQDPLTFSLQECSPFVGMPAQPRSLEEHLLGAGLLRALG